MLNQVVIVGRLVQDPEIKELENDKKVGYITLAVQRPYKNVDGIYETDFIKCQLWNGIAQNTTEFCKKGDVLGVKGRLQSENYEESEEKKTKLILVAEKVTFLSSRKKDEENE